MKKYTIKYTYDTGDSFKNEYDLEDTIDISWDNLDIAKKNLERIEQHYKQYKELNSYRGRGNQVILEENQGKDWFVFKPLLVCYKGNKKSYNAIDESQKQKAIEQGYSTDYITDESTAKHQIILYTDEGKPFQFHAPWCGYFESLNSVEIIMAEDKTLKKIF